MISANLDLNQLIVTLIASLSALLNGLGGLGGL